MQKITLKKRQRGQGMTEYIIIIIALIVLAAIGVYSGFGDVILFPTVDSA